MKQVTEEQFYVEIREKKLDVCPRPIGDYPFTSEFRFRNGVLWGIAKPTERDPKKYPRFPWYEVQYFINR